MDLPVAFVSFPRALSGLRPPASGLKPKAYARMVFLRGARTVGAVVSRERNITRVSPNIVFGAVSNGTTRSIWSPRATIRAA